MAIMLQMIMGDQDHYRLTPSHLKKWLVKSNDIQGTNS